MPISRKHLEALKDEINWIGSGAIVAAGFFLGMPLLIPFAWLGFEAAYLLFVPDSRWYERRLSRRHDAEVVRRRQQLRRRLWPALLPEDRQQYETLEQLRREIDAQQPGEGASQREMLRKLDFLMERFLMFGGKRAEYLEYLRRLRAQEIGTGTERRSWWGKGPEPSGAAEADALVERLTDHYHREIETINRQMGAEETPRNTEILLKNIQVLARCRENIEQIGQIVGNLTHQMELVVNTFTLINGQARTRPPEQMLPEVQDVVGSSEALTEALAELAPLDEAVQRLGRLQS